MLNVTALEEYIKTKRNHFASSTRLDRKKDLQVGVNGQIYVIVDNNIVWQGLSPMTAINEYNKIE